MLLLLLFTTTGAPSAPTDGTWLAFGRRRHRR